MYFGACKSLHRRGKLSAVDLSKALFDPESAADVMNTVSELIKGKYKSIRVRNKMVLMSDALQGKRLIF